jgi:hypothetical protein
MTTPKPPAEPVLIPCAICGRLSPDRFCSTECRQVSSFPRVRKAAPPEPLGLPQRRRWS